MEPNNNLQTEVAPRQRTWRALSATAYRRWIPDFSLTNVLCALWVLWLLFGHRLVPDFSSPAAHIVECLEDCATQTSHLAAYILPLSSRVQNYSQAQRDLVLGAQNLPYAVPSWDRGRLRRQMSDIAVQLGNYEDRLVSLRLAALYDLSFQIAQFRQSQHNITRFFMRPTATEYAVFAQDSFELARHLIRRVDHYLDEFDLLQYDVLMKLHHATKGFVYQIDFVSPLARTDNGDRQALIAAGAQVEELSARLRQADFSEVQKLLYDLRSAGWVLQARTLFRVNPHVPLAEGTRETVVRKYAASVGLLVDQALDYMNTGKQ
ncbi:hypothetical protein DFH06DRAFT_1384933 [Mycena polygramma]|nr:hypothetical protein DFH06DRAFT_1384933 [Mycena polygramma]